LVKRILVTGCGGAAAANFIKSLRMSDERYYIVGTDTNKYKVSLSNTDISYISEPVTSPTYLENLNKIIKKEKIDFVHPQPDEEVLFISENREKINAKTYLPDKRTIRVCQNKWILIQQLRENHVSVPAHNITGERWIRATMGAGSKASLPVETDEEITMWINYWKKRELPIQFIVSEFLPGKEYAVQSLWKDGNLIVSQARERLEYLFGYLTPSGQTSSPSVAKTIHNDTVNDTATKAVLAVDKKATGVFGVDLKENDKGIPCVTEINAGRFYTTSNFFTEAGLNMPHMHIQLAFGEIFGYGANIDPLESNLYWVRGMDVKAKLLRFKDDNLE